MSALSARHHEPLPVAGRDVVTVEGLSPLAVLRPAAAHDVRIEAA